MRPVLPAVLTALSGKFFCRALWGTLFTMKENDFLQWLDQVTPKHPAVDIPIGDDMAAVTLPDSPALLKIDQCLDLVHVDSRTQSPFDIGRKAVNRCLSDCAAMACMPAAVLISVALPRQTSADFAQQLYLGCRAAADAFDCPIVGGDTGVWDQRLAITIAALGRKIGPIARRDGGKPGDVICVSGELGGSILGRHLTFTPRIELARELARRVNIHAMMDLSDGLLADLPRLCRKSGTGAIIYAPHIPIHQDVLVLSAQTGKLPVQHALGDGEDYELLLTLAQEDVARVADLDITPIGMLTAEPGLFLADGSGQLQPWPAGGYEHQSEA